MTNGAVLAGADVDSGTAFEIGYGFAKGKYLIGIRTDYRAMTCLNRNNPVSAEVNLMIKHSLNAYCKDIETLTKILEQIKQSN